jgi:phage repressor protein C with HTH and peptisase S24 domain
VANVPLMNRIELVDLIDRRLAELSLSAAEVSRRAVQNQYAVRNIKERGSVPRLDQASALLDVLGFDLVAVERGSGSGGVSQNAPGVFVDRQLLHRGLARCGVSGWGRPEAREPLPAPSNLNDPDAFYVQATGRSMEPEGIRTGDTVLVSPNADPEIGGRVYVEDREGRGSIKRVVDLNGKTIRLRGWRPDGGSFKDFIDERQLDYVKVLAPVIAVFERKPEVGELEQRKADPRRPDEAFGTVPLLGFAAAGNDVVFDTAVDDGTRVSPPPGGGTGLGAISVRGSSMAPMARDGDTIYIDISRPFAPADCVGRPVIARDSDGGTYLKTLRRGDDAKRWNLESADLRYETMTNIDLEQVFPVRWIALSKST